MSGKPWGEAAVGPKLVADTLSIGQAKLTGSVVLMVVALGQLPDETEAEK